MSEITRATSELAIQPGQTGFTTKQVAALRQLGVEKVNESDLAVFFHQCVRTGLDPFARQVYLVGRWDGRSQSTKYTIQTGIDGYRLIAERTGAYAGSDESWVEGPNGLPASATVTVYKAVADVVRGFTATAHWSEYCQTAKDGRPMGLWAKMPHRMLAKCAEALALRKAFPQDLSGVYTDEEMSQANSERPASRVIEAQPVKVQTLPSDITDTQDTESSEAVEPEQLELLKTLREQAGLTDEQYRRGIEKVAGVDTTNKLTKSNATDVITALERLVKKRQQPADNYWDVRQMAEGAV